MVTKILLIRHGETDWNLEGRYQGHADIDLNSTGRRQAKKLSVRLREEEIDAVYSSDRMRAANTAKIVFKKHKARPESGFREINFGVFEGLTHNEILEKYPKVYSRWVRNLLGIRIPQGENPSVFKKRVLNTFKRIVSSNKGKAVAIVAHGGPVNVIIKHILGPKKHKDFIPGLASLSVIEFKKGEAVTVLLNDTRHLG